MRREATLDDMRRVVRRYLTAFGPAAVAVARAWSGVSGLPEVFERVRPELRTFADEAGRELFDLPDAPRPDEDVPAPVRFLPEFDASLLAYADRTRLMTDDVRRQVCVGPSVAPTVLVDGEVRATWALTRTGDTASLEVRPLRPLHAADRSAVEAEAERLLAFVIPEATRRDVRLRPTPRSE